MSQLARGRARSLTSVVTAWGWGGRSSLTLSHMYSIDAVSARPAAGAVSGAAGVPDPAIGGVLCPTVACFTFSTHTRGGRGVAVTRAKKLGQGASTRSVNAPKLTRLNLVKAEHRNGPNEGARGESRDR
jgi:hypothetical protein